MKDFKGNEEPNKKLAKLATDKATELYIKGAEKYDYLKGKNITWNPRLKTWELDKITLPQFSNNGVSFPSDDAHAEMYIDDKGEAQFKINGRELKEFKDVAKTHFETMLERTLTQDTLKRYESVRDLKLRYPMLPNVAAAMR